MSIPVYYARKVLAYVILSHLYVLAFFMHSYTAVIRWATIEVNDGEQ